MFTNRYLVIYHKINGTIWVGLLIRWFLRIRSHGGEFLRILLPMVNHHHETNHHFGGIELPVKSFTIHGMKSTFLSWASQLAQKGEKNNDDNKVTTNQFKQQSISIAETTRMPRLSSTIPWFHKFRVGGDLLFLNIEVANFQPLNPVSRLKFFAKIFHNMNFIQFKFSQATPRFKSVSSDYNGP